jgi:TonB family protein
LRFFYSMTTALVFFFALSAEAEAKLCPFSAEGFAPLADGKSYAFRLQANDLYLGSVKLALWSATKSYSVTLDHVSIDRVRTVAHPLGAALRDDIVFSVGGPVQIVELPAPDAILAIRAVGSDADLVARSFQCVGALVEPFPQRLAERPSQYRSTMRATQDAMLREAGKSEVTRIVANLGVPLVAVDCEHPFVSARLTAAHLNYPDDVLRQRGMGVVAVDVALSAAGAFTRVSLLRSSGWPSLDRETQDEAAAATYQPEVFRCEATPSELLFLANFSYGR